MKKYTWKFTDDEIKAILFALKEIDINKFSKEEMDIISNLIFRLQTSVKK